MDRVGRRGSTLDEGCLACHIDFPVHHGRPTPNEQNL